MNRIMAPSRPPQKRLICRGKTMGFRDARPLGAAMGSSAFLPHRAKYCPNGGMGLGDVIGMATRAGSFGAG
jgi:hypothetical protein